MFMKSWKLYAFTFVGMAMIVATCMLAPPGYAGGAVTLVPADDRMVPGGSHISEHRKNKIEQKVQVYKATRKQKAEKQQQNQSLQASDTNESEAPEEK